MIQQGQQQKTAENEARINRRIRAREVRLIGSDGSQLGVVSITQALEQAEEEGLDLVEVAPDSRPPVCRIMDYGKFKYQKKKRQAEAKKRQVQVVLKEVKIRYKTDEHDLVTKINQARRFLMEGNKVKFVMFFKGREVQFAELGYHVMERVAADLVEVSVMERPPRMEHRILAMYFASKGVVKDAGKESENEDAKDEE
ncbi:MAG TPA: translation initiation factor IF-3 [Myxococcota bacterium]|nr:translation initiation factor IF-3 [Myxococcota bacterium]HOA12312.1 translation initiation factor IF-3 [Myxococcota bacterium]HOC98437.1 translation initiation factor IF-3 [Myxococcota bacterium]HOH75617.1 translation initiation factor IF-3 [Myxococcota bacterium]